MDDSPGEQASTPTPDQTGPQLFMTIVLLILLGVGIILIATLIGALNVFG